jgi:hypothetical protein
MRALTVVSLFLCACTSGSDRRSDIRYSSHPDTGECVVTDPAAGMDDGTWETCEPDCMGTGMCADVCPAIDCGGDGMTDPSGGTMGSDGTDPSGMSGGGTGGGVVCPDGFLIGPDGCPTCECYEPPCDDDPPPPCDPATGVDCCPAGMDPTTGMGCCFADGTCCDPASTMGCPPPPPPPCDPMAGIPCCDDGSTPAPDGTCPPPTCDPSTGMGCCSPDGTACCDPSSGMGCDGMGG